MRSLIEQCEERGILRERKRESRARQVKHVKRSGTPATREQVVETLKGRTISEAARVLGYSLGGMRSIMAIHGVRVEGSRLTADDHEMICQLIEARLTRAEVAEKFERTEETISNVYRKTRGRHIDRGRLKG